MCRILQSLKQLLPVFLIVAAFLSMTSCSEEPPLKIGFVGGLTGRVADLGVAGRDAVILAIEEKNRSGGIAGRKVELVVRDDRQDAESAKQAIRELTNEQVVAIIGPMTSSMAAAIQPLINAEQIVTISPTAKSDQFSGQDDFFLRVTAPLSRNAERIAEHAVKELNLKRFVVVYDESNQAFSVTWLDYFKKSLLANGGHVVAEEPFTSGPSVHFLPIAERILLTKPEAVLFVSNAIDTALLAQQIRKLESNIPFFSSEWAFTTDLLSFGGGAVNGMISFHSFNANSQGARYLAFAEKFAKRFGYAPSFATVLAYDAVSYLFEALEMTPSRHGLKEALLKIGSFTGLQSDVIVDQFGDVEQKLFLTTIANSQFKVVE